MAEASITHFHDFDESRPLCRSFITPIGPWESMVISYVRATGSNRVSAANPGAFRVMLPSVAVES